MSTPLHMFPLPPRTRHTQHRTISLPHPLDLKLTLPILQVLKSIKSLFRHLSIFRESHDSQSIVV